MIRNLAKHALRDDNRGILMTDAELDRLIVAPHSCDPSRWAELAEMRRAIATGLDTLAVRERECASLHWFDGLTVPEIATRLGVARSTVKETLRRARKKLDARLTPYKRSKRPA